MTRIATLLKCLSATVSAWTRALVSMVRGNQPSKPKPRLAIVTAFFGDYAALRIWAKSRMEIYAAKIGAVVIELTERRFPDQPVPWEKFQLYELLAEFDRVIWIDGDCKVEEHCPDLFALVPRGYIGMYDEGSNENPTGLQFRAEAVSRCCWQLGITPKAVPPYFNAGVMVVSRDHRDIFREPVFVTCPMIEQTLINVRMRGYPVFSLSVDFNQMLDHTKTAYIQHYAVMSMENRLAAFTDEKMPG